MCGIAGLVQLKAQPQPPARDALERMARALAHRGPDELGVYRDARAGLAHSRLSIIDLAAGQQPMQGDDGLTVVFNGEIFNYVELREELAQKGRRFRTHSDTEVVLAAYAEWGSGCFARFNGQWAIALWDPASQRLVLSRDRLGVRPLYLCEHAGVLYFASEVKAIFAADRDVPRALDPIGLAETFTFWSVVPPQSVFVGVEELRPGATRTIALGDGAPRVTDELHWQTSFPTGDAGRFRGSLEDATEAVLSALREATRLRMTRSDVPVGSYLSGGLDSSLVAALGLAFKGERFQTFSLRFEDAEYDETEFQRVMARHIGSDHHEVVVSRADIAGCFADVIDHTERPVLRTAPAPMYLLSGLVRRQGVKVVLTGEGADEMFAGYDLFREAKLRRWLAKSPASKCRPLLFDRLYPYLARSPVSQRTMALRFFGRDLDKAREPGFGHGTRWHGAAALQRLFSAPMRAALAAGPDPIARFVAGLPPAFAGWTPLAQDQYVEIATLLSGYILASQGDRMLMGHSVEGRFPFLDKEVVALAHSLPDAFKLQVLDEKHVLKRAAKGLVPDAVLARKKQPYRAPDALSFSRGPLPERVAAALAPEAVKDAGVFEPELAARLIAKCRNPELGDHQFSNADNMAFIGLLSTQLLHAGLVRGEPRLGDAPLVTVIDRTRKDRPEGRP